MKWFAAAAALLAASLAVPASAGEVRLQLVNGRITLQARDATVREILTEWARVGQVKIVNAERIMGAPVTLDLQGVTEAQALTTLLRSVSGYMAAMKAEVSANASIYDRIVINAAPRTAATVNAAAGGYAPTQPAQQFRNGMPPGMPNPAMLDDQDEPAGAPPTYPTPQYGFQPGARGVGVPQPGAAGGAVQPGTLPQGTPGTVSPMPQQQTPGMPVQPGVMPPGMVAPPTGAPGAVTPPPKKPGGPGEPGGTGGN